MSYTRCFYHIIFRTKHSEKVLSPFYEKELFQKIWAFCKDHRVFLHRINGMEEHLHLAVDLPPNYAVANFVKDLKIYTSAFLKNNPHFPYFTNWAEGYCALSYGDEEKESVIAYITQQKEHHKQVGFLHEIHDTLKNAGLLKDEQYFQRHWEE